ncbi:MAG: Carbamoyl-phosphate synthase large chain, partial [uncultured Gemmatimonadetes bacterium]
AQAHRPPEHPDPRLRADHHRAGRRVRLQRDAGREGAAGGGVQGDPGQQQPGHDHDRPRPGRRHLHRAHHPRMGGAGDRKGEAGRHPPHHGRADGAERGAGAARPRDAGAPRRGADRRQRARHPHGGGPQRVRQGHAAHRAAAAARGVRAVAGGGAAAGGGHRLPGHHPPVVHHGRHGGRDRLQPRGVRGAGAPRDRPVAGERGADRPFRDRVEGVRAGGDARRGGQRGHHLLHRELRRHGRAHGRLGDGGPRADADRRGVPADARRRHRHHPRDRRGGGRVQRAVRGQSRGRRAARGGDEPARVALVGPGVQGDGIPHRAHRRQAGRGLHTGRAAQRHHPVHPRLLRAGAGLRGGQVPPLRVREVPRGRPHAGGADEGRGRVDGHRPHLQAGVAEGDPRAGGGAQRVGDGDAGRRPAGGRRRGDHPPRAAPPDPRAAVPDEARAGGRVRARGGGVAHGRRSVVRGAARAARGGRAGVRGAGRGHAARDAAHEADGVQRRAARPPARRDGGGRARAALGDGHPPRVQPRGHLRGRVPGHDSVPLLHLRGGERGGARGAPQGDDPGLGAQPHRAGGGVRLLLRAGRARPARRRVGDHHGQLQPGDGVHGLRRVRQAVLRAADAGGRAGDRAGGAAGRRDRAARRADAAEAGGAPGAPGRPHHRHSHGGHRPRGGPRALRGAGARAGDQAAPQRPGRVGGPGGGDRGAHRIPGAPAPQLRAGRAGDGDRVRRALAARLLRAGGAGEPRPPRADRPLPGGRLRGRRGRALGWRDGGDRGGDAAHRGGRDPLRRLGVRAAALHAQGPPRGGDARADAPLRAGAGRRGAHQRAVRRLQRRGVRDRGEPARVAHGALCVQGHRGAAGADRGAADGGGEAGRLRASGRDPGGRGGGEGGRLPLQQAPRGGPAAGPRDALHRGGDGVRRLVRDGIRQGPDLGGDGPSARGPGDHHRERPRQGDGHPHRAAALRHGLPHRRNGRHGAVPARPRHPVRARLQGERGPPQHGGPHHLGRRGAADQHAPRQAEPVRRLRHAPGRHPVRRPVHHHHVRRQRRRRRHRRAPHGRARGALDPGPDVVADAAPL